MICLARAHRRVALKHGELTRKAAAAKIGRESAIAEKRRRGALRVATTHTHVEEFVKTVELTLPPSGVLGPFGPGGGRDVGGITDGIGRAASWTACHGVRSHPVPVALVGECSMPVV